MRFKNLRELAQLCERESRTISSIMIQDQVEESGQSEEEILAAMNEYYQIMKTAVHKGLTEDIVSTSGLTGGDAKRVEAYRNRSETSVGDIACQAMAYALAVSEVNASMGRIVATPTAGSCGIIPGVFVSAQERFGWEDEHLVRGLFCAGAIGYVIANNSFISGAEGGCQAEIGSAIGMAAGAMVELRGGTPEQAVHAVGLALKNTLGLICDPVGGLVEIPCIVRNGFGAVNALAAADMALAGVRSAIPSDEVIDVMLEVGSAMPSRHRETAQGGLAQTPTGRKIMKELRSRKK
ncbi:L-serine ammonia-lyase, iron-sulfur-dependent, subunit alpha [Paenibacillus phoenicis]|jgi:L-serine dehydratase|uniref:L-serine dehydratase n=1 Tax=Paenibacillus phoenicis TaxID=554117 RepID=A0ABU5PF01_9BACL|nr:MULTISPECIES: L-serine ammonia-lyase, iron-sulfur-dependent, subunit alpha [Paenibacillus]EES71803.1 L-serine dehydratase, iron-sulfur-dependent, alpha subunit [Paenibacillus sp. oral taxon 786 str. D14]MCT2193694.1 L-serine ammonia-lyase, iron-sulfur-dependent, subunit alpha [Paenibacillus sp. p3-SID1389]MDU0331976.1 L-serine ammonia-lyase, iron-sulfur-dependent, subunit alpha [Paenibacillus sp. 3LSP]MEA3568499.1 L-serine ammonia-lyase, iron-sulfur-dependent, subunit alpha [Paenibacillus ph